MNISYQTLIFCLLSLQTTAFLPPFSDAAKATKTKVEEKKSVFGFLEKSEKVVVEETPTKSPTFSLPKFGASTNESPSKGEITSSKSSLLSDIPSPVGLAGTAMGAIAPLFALEAKIQAGVLTGIVDVLGAPFRVYPEEIREQIKRRISSTKPVLYTYGLSPFSVEAKSILDEYDVEVIQLGAEWFLLGPAGSEQRVALSENSSNEQTSLPHLFYKGESLGGLSTGGRNNSGITGLLKSGDLNKLLPKKKAGKK